MGLIDTILGKKRSAKNSPRLLKSQNYFLTNSQEFGFGDIKLDVSRKIKVDALLAIEALGKIAIEMGHSFKFCINHTSLLKHGVLKVPVACTIGAKKFSLFFIYQEADLTTYRGLIKQIIQTPYPNLMYFSSIPVYEGYRAKSIYEPFRISDLRYDRDIKMKGSYAMWWSTEDDPLFHKSKTFECLSNFNKMVKGYESYMAGYVLMQTRILEGKDLQRMRLPERNVTYVLNAPEEKNVLLDLSKEKGIRFLFNFSKTTAEYRDRFIKGAVLDIIANICLLKQKGLPTDEDIEPNSYDWFSFMSRVVKQKEEAGEMIGHQIGLLEI